MSMLWLQPYIGSMVAPFHAPVLLDLNKMRRLPARVTFLGGFKIQPICARGRIDDPPSRELTRLVCRPSGRIGAVQPIFRIKNGICRLPAELPPPAPILTLAPGNNCHHRHEQSPRDRCFSPGATAAGLLTTSRMIWVRSVDSRRKAARPLPSGPTYCHPSSAKALSFPVPFILIIAEGDRFELPLGRTGFFLSSQFREQLHGKNQCGDPNRRRQGVRLAFHGAPPAIGSDPSTSGLGFFSMVLHIFSCC